ncbi:hypothetical protein AMJ52_03290 [candidate division TA06 bacterium DG_78]|uniref:PatA-like N-terminal domain-containing protein n=1 Tax=candidate division TA06 bacterium DG_78 TaxID=1703772 RepID=A0A0S7YH14_UNCT6|nr:MAG: hypothetical protein AMJ52_03290 [candidate division TA06 bacterium DG_78]
MPVEGDLKSLNLASVLQLIAQERLTGVFKIKRRNEIVDVGFLDGMVTGAFYERGEEFERLETYLVKSGIIGQNVYQMVLQIHRQTKRPVMNIILEDKYLTVEEVEKIIKFKIQEVFDQIFTWQEGEFKFEQGAVIYPKSLIKIRMATEGLILEAARHFDEWPRITKTISSGELVYKKVERPELKLRPADDEKRVLALIDGHRSVNDLVEISGLGKFHTYSCLYHLLSTGQIEVAYAKPHAEKEVRPKKQFSFKAITTPLIIGVTVLVLVFEVLLGNYINNHNIISIDIVDEQIYRTDYTQYQKIYFYRHNRTPVREYVENIFYP